MNYRFDEIKESNNATIDTEINSVRCEFSSRMEGLAKKVETRVTETLQKTTDSKIKAVKVRM